MASAHVSAAALGIRASTGQDQTAAINAALAKLAPGQTLVLSPGVYLISATLLMSSGTGLSGAGATIQANPYTWQPAASDDPALATGYAMLANRDFGAAKPTDSGLTVSSLTFDFDGFNPTGSHAIRFRSASNVAVTNCHFTGGDDATAFIGCNTTLVQNCTAIGTTNAAFDHWEGTSNAVVTGCTAQVASGTGILFTAASSHLADRAMTNVTATGNHITGTFGPNQAGILVDTLSAGSSVAGVTLTGNVVDGLGTVGAGIGTAGRVAQITISGNTVRNVVGLALFGVSAGAGAAGGLTISGNILAGNTLANAGHPATDALAQPAGTANPIWLSGSTANVTTNGPTTVMDYIGAATVRTASALNPLSTAQDNVLVFGGTGSLSFLNGNELSTVIGGSGAVTVAGGVGGGVFLGGSGGHNFLATGQGASTLIGNGTGDVLSATGSAAQVLIAGIGNTTLGAGGSSGANLLVGRAGNDVIAAGSGATTMVGGGGRDTISAGSGDCLILAGSNGGIVAAGHGDATVVGATGGAAQYAFTNGHTGGDDLITGFRVGIDHIALSGYATSTSVIIAGGTSGGGSSVFHLSDGTNVTLVGVASLGTSIFT